MVSIVCITTAFIFYESEPDQRRLSRSSHREEQKLLTNDWKLSVVQGYHTEQVDHICDVSVSKFHSYAFGESR